MDCGCNVARAFSLLIRFLLVKDFENAISHKDSNAVLLVKSHAVLFHVLIAVDDEYFAAVQEKIQKKRQVLGATKREEAIGVAGKRRKGMERLKVVSQSNCSENWHRADHNANIVCIGATTLDEYRKHIEKDPALERRFQPVKVPKPIVDGAIELLQGLREPYEIHHKLHYIVEAAVAAQLFDSMGQDTDMERLNKLTTFLKKAFQHALLCSWKSYGAQVLRNIEFWRPNAKNIKFWRPSAKEFQNKGVFNELTL
ncbi:hypothetical protein Fmac_006273 [Flemingia macrophylla]|uniref:Uncharacterized protein n=1 Tax=Flemingia macrophylla TaxID=520843 RepID=A0ABD1NBM0_9FABA